MSLPAVDIVTLTRNDRQHLAFYFEALANLDYPRDRVRLIVVDNGSQDDTCERTREHLAALPFAGELVETGKNLGFGPANNLGAARGSAPYVLFLNPDTIVATDMLALLAGRAVSEPRAGIVDAVQLPENLNKWYDPETHHTDWCTGAAMLVRREVFDSIEGFDPFFYPIYCEDVDLSWRTWLAGWTCVHEPRARFVHTSVSPGCPIRPNTMRLAIQFSFAMRLIYGDRGEVARHFVRGLRYLASPRTDPPTRKAVLGGLWVTARGARHLLRRRKAARSALRGSDERQRFVFSEWFYGRWLPEDRRGGQLPCTQPQSDVPAAV